MALSGETKYYFDYHYPLKVVQFILSLIFGPGKPGPEVIDTSEREWFSQPRPGADKTTEVVSTLFKLPLSVSEITMDILRVPCVVEVWYQDRNNNWRQVMDMQRNPLRAYVSGSDAKSWYKYHSKVYPLVAKQVQFRLTRSDEPRLASVPFVCGLRNTLIRRNVYDRAQGTQYFEEEQDILGNVINKYIKDWDAGRAFDNDPNTFWKSAPMPDPMAVASMYLDVRATDGTPKLIDKLYIDPVYTGQMLNLYYSSDDTVGTRKLSPITLYPDEDVNTEWRVGPEGRVDNSGDSEDSFYRWSLSVGPLVSQDAWIGMEWIPNFPSTDGPAIEPVLIRAISTGPTLAHKPSVYYDVGAKRFYLSFDNGTDPPTEYYVQLTQEFVAGEPMRVMVGWTYGPDTVHIEINNRKGEMIAVAYSTPVANLPQLVSFDGQVEMWNFSGSMTAAIIKLDDYHRAGAFHASPVYYCNPDPVIPDDQGNIPATSLDNAIYSVAWTSQEHGTGGAHESHYEDKEWTPIWKDYTTRKGTLVFPQTLSMKYLKLEFYNLTEAPYPIYESGIQVRYKVFPISVMQQSTLGPRLYTGEGGFLGQGSFISLNGVRSVNWLSPSSVLTAVGAVFTPQIPPVVIQQGNPYISESIPNQDNTKVNETYRVELSSAYVYRREALNPYILAEDQYNTIIKAEGLGAISDFTDVPWSEIEAANPGAISKVRSSVGAIPLRGSDWWIFPGQELRIPASVMTKLTSTSTVTERKLTLEHRVRFNTTAIHRYAYKTLNRDAAIAYFAGVREVIPFTSSYVPGEDKPVFDFTRYDKTVWNWDSDLVRQLESGPVTAAGKVYRISNPSFDNGLVNWTPGPAGHTWVQDKSQGHYALGSARVSANEVPQELLSNTRLEVTPGDVIDLSAWVRWASLVVTNGQSGMTLGVVTYLDGEEVARPVIAQIAYPDWTANTSSGVGASSFVELKAPWTVPAGVDEIRVRLALTEEAHSGNVWFDLVTLKDHNFDPNLPATLDAAFTTQSDFAKVLCEFRDSGLIRSDSMWADIDQTSEAIEDTKLAPYVQTIPPKIPTGTWGDTLKTWGAAIAEGPIEDTVSTEWGTPFSIVSITVDGMRRYQGNRVLHIIRAAEQGEAGLQMKQFTHWFPMGLFRLGFVAYKPFANDNKIMLRLRRLSDGVMIYQETIDMPVGRWVEYQTKFTEIPNSADQEYMLMLTMIGDDRDELYVSDLYSEIASIRYYITLGGGLGPPLIEVSDLRYVQGYAQVVTPTPVNEMTVTTTIMSPEAYAYGCSLQPAYLK